MGGALPGVTSTSAPDLWWLAIARDDYRQRRTVGVILLCAGVDEPLRDFGLPAHLIAGIESQLSVGSERPHLDFTVVRRGSRFELQLKGGRALDLTDRLGNLSWIDRSARRALEPAASTPDAGAHGGVLATEAGERYGAVVDSPAEDLELRFFGRGGPADLPRDLADQHDHYAHGAPRR